MSERTISEEEARRRVGRDRIVAAGLGAAKLAAERRAAGLCAFCGDARTGEDFCCDPCAIRVGWLAVKALAYFASRPDA